MAFSRKRVCTIALVALGLAAAVIVALTDMSKSAEPRLVLRGRVSDATTGHPIEGAMVSDDRYGPKPHKTAITDSAGRYRVVTWAEEHSVIAEAAGYKPQRQTLTVSLLQTEKERLLDFALVPD